MASRFTERDLKPWGGARPADEPVHPAGTYSHYHDAFRDPARDLRPWAWYVLGRAAAEVPSTVGEAERYRSIFVTTPYGCDTLSLYGIQGAVRQLRFAGEISEVVATHIDSALAGIGTWVGALADRRARYPNGAALRPGDFTSCPAFQEFRAGVAAAARSRPDPYHAFGTAVGRWLVGLDWQPRSADGRPVDLPSDCLGTFTQIREAYGRLPAGRPRVPELDALRDLSASGASDDAGTYACFGDSLMGWEPTDDPEEPAWVQVSTVDSTVTELADHIEDLLLVLRRSTGIVVPSLMGWESTDAPEQPVWVQVGTVDEGVARLADDIEDSLLVPRRSTGIVVPTLGHRPQWNKKARTLVVGEVDYEVHGQAAQIEKVLDAFQAAGWSSEVTVSLRCGQVSNTVKSLNKRYPSLRFSGRKSGQVSWKLAGSRT